MAFIQRGEIISYGSPAEIKKQKMKHKILEITPSDVAKTLKVLEQIQDSGSFRIEEVELFGSQIHLICDNHEKLKTIISKELQKVGINPGVMSTIEPSLEDVFIASMKAN